MMSGKGGVSIRGKGVLIGGALLRLLLFSLGFYHLFGFRKEIVTPVTDFKRVIEGLFLMNLGQNPYNGDVYHQAPLLLAIFYPFQQYLFLMRFIFILVDILIALCLVKITSMWQDKMKSVVTQDQKKDRKEQYYTHLANRHLPELIAFLYLFNPFTVMNCVGMSTITFSNLAVIGSLYFALKNNASLCTFCLSAATYLSTYPLVLIFPLSLLLNKGLMKTFALVVLWSGWLMALSYSMVSSWQFLMETYGFNMLVSDLSPNIGLFWYFFTEVFKHYRAFYLFAYQYHAFMYSIPLYLRLRNEPMFLFWINLAIIGCFKSYPAVGDIALQMSLVPLIYEAVKENKYSFVILIAALFVTVLAPLFWWLWLYSGTGNANFYYAINLVSTLAQVLFITNSLSEILKNQRKRKLD